MGDKKEEQERTIFHSKYSNGIKTNRDSWDYNSSRTDLGENISFAISNYNSEVDRIHSLLKNNETLNILDAIDYDSSKFAWDYAQKEVDLPKGIKYTFDRTSIVEAIYRPFYKQYCYYKRHLINRMYQTEAFYPGDEYENALTICVSGVGVTKPFSCLLTKQLTDLEFIGKSQCFPLYYYEENKATQLSLFDSGSNEKYIRRDGITDWILKTVRDQYGSRSITKEMIFYYVYGLLHSEDYRKTFEADLKKSLPRIPIVDKLADFIAFEKAGRKLANLHLDYEEVEPYKGVKVEMEGEVGDPYEYYKIVDKMRFAKKTDAEKGKKVDDKSTIVYNGHITIKNIPEEAYEYVVNGKSAIEWIVERYAVTTDKKSLIKNDCNDWSREHNAPRYILDLMLSVINVSVQTVEIVKGLPKLKFE